MRCLATALRQEGAGAHGFSSSSLQHSSLVVSGKSSALKSRGVAKVEVEQATQARAGSDCPERAVVVSRCGIWADELSAETLMVSLGA